MKPAPFEYHAPRDVGTALALLAEHADDAKLLAGGQSLIPMMNMRLARPAHVLDLGRIPGLDTVAISADSIVLGSMVRHRTIETSTSIGDANRLLPAAARLISHFQIRERGTLGGSLAHADPTAEMPLVATVLGATIHVASATARRDLAAGEFFQSMFTTDLAPDEMIQAVTIPRLREREGAAIAEVARRHGDYAIVAAAAVVEVRDGVYRHVRVGLAGVGPTPVLGTAVEQLVGQAPKPGAWRDVASEVTLELDPDSDIHASASDRRDIARSLIVRVLEEATVRSLSVGAHGQSGDLGDVR